METVRISTEQIHADNQFINGLEKNIKEWETELAWTERELVEQALIDSKEGARSNRYLMLETREKNLKKYLQEAREKLGRVAERYDIGPLKSLLSTALKQIRP